MRCQYLLEFYLLVSDNSAMTTPKEMASHHALIDMENRRRQLRAWIDTHFEGKQADFVRANNLNQGEISSLLRNKSFGGVKARNLEAACGMPTRYLEQPAGEQNDRGGSEQVASTVHLTGSLADQPEYAGQLSFLKRVPVIGVARMGDEGWYDEISTAPGHGDGHVEVLTRDKNAYALRVRGDSMAPAIRDGWIVVVEPNGSVAPGEYVLVKMLDGRKMVKELLYQRTDTVTVLSVNGAHRLTLPAKDVDELQPVTAIIPPSKWLHE